MTGVQTCALPICPGPTKRPLQVSNGHRTDRENQSGYLLKADATQTPATNPFLARNRNHVPGTAPTSLALLFQTGPKNTNTDPAKDEYGGDGAFQGYVFIQEQGTKTQRNDGHRKLGQCPNRRAQPR